MPDREKVMSWLEGLAEPDWRDFHSDSEVQNIAKSALALLKEQEDLGTELTNAVDLIHKKNERIEKLLKKQETKLICNLLGGQPYEVYCRECRTILCILGKGETMNDAKSVFSYCPHCGREVKWG